MFPGNHQWRRTQIDFVQHQDHLLLEIFCDVVVQGWRKLQHLSVEMNTLLKYYSNDAILPKYYFTYLAIEKNTGPLLTTNEPHENGPLEGGHCMIIHLKDILQINVQETLHFLPIPKSGNRLQ